MQISQLLEEGETVSMALRRLGKHSRSRPQKRRKKEGNEEIVENKSDEETRVKFNTLVEAASSLIDAGETDVYDQERSYFQRCASVYIDIEGLEGPSNLLSRGISEAAYEEANQDMFADEDDTETGQHEASGHTASLGGKPITKGEDFASWSVKVLKQYLTDKGIDISGIVEKEELVSKAKSCGPPGYDYDPNSGMWYSSESEMYWDPKSGGFWNPRDQKWYTYSEGGWVPWD